jgi:solute carrier family 25 phosphate transporter 23/24/25/41
MFWGCVHRFVTELWEGGDSGVVEGNGMVEVEMQATAVVLGGGGGGVGLGDVLESEEEREARVRRLFAVLDQRQAGYLDHEQIEAGLAAMSFLGRRKCALELLDVCDSNRDSRIDLFDFRCYVNAKERELYVLFQSIDVSRDGVIEAEEMWIALSSSGKSSSLHSSSPMSFSVSFCVL